MSKVYISADGENWSEIPTLGGDLSFTPTVTEPYPTVITPVPSTYEVGKRTWTQDLGITGDMDWLPKPRYDMSVRFKPPRPVRPEFEGYRTGLRGLWDILTGRDKRQTDAYLDALEDYYARLAAWEETTEVAYYPSVSLTVHDNNTYTMNLHPEEGY